MAEHLEDILGSAIATILREQIVPLQRRLDILEADSMRTKAMLEQRNFAYVGAWKEGRTYGQGMFTTYSGAMWHCNQPNTTVRPGDTASWTLADRMGDK